MSTTILLADDHSMVRAGLRLIIETQPGVKVVGEADNGHEAVTQTVRMGVDIVIMDISMPDLNGIEATRQVQAACPGTDIIMLSMYASSKHIFHALKAGARGYLLKSSASGEIIAAIQAVAKGGYYLSQKISADILDELRQYEIEQLRDPLDRLSSREREVLQLVVEGRSSPEIADQLHISPKTVETYRSRVMEKLNLKDIPSLVRFALEWGLISLEED